MKTPVQWLAAEEKVAELKREYQELASWEYQRKVDKIAKAKEIAREFGVDRSVFLESQNPLHYFDTLWRLLGKGAVNAIE